MDSSCHPMICVLVLLAAGCDFHSFHYDASGRLLYSTGAPASGVTVVLDGPSPWDTEPPELGDFERQMPHEYVREMKAETDSDGRFHARFVAGKLYSTMSCTPPPGQELPEVYVWANYQRQWWPIIVPIDSRMQQRAYPGGRHIDLPDVSLPQK
jgi:hypothetical protein